MTLFKKDPLQIIAFQSYGTDMHFYLRGRALQDESIDLEQGGFFRLLINSWKRIETDKVKNVAISITLSNGTILKTKSDSKGYFKIEADLQGLRKLANARRWSSVYLVAVSDFLRSLRLH